MAESTDKAEVDGSKVMQVLTKNELERLTEVFKMYETGVREAAIRPSVSPVGRKSEAKAQWSVRWAPMVPGVPNGSMVSPR